MRRPQSVVRCARAALFLAVIGTCASAFADEEPPGDDEQGLRFEVGPQIGVVGFPQDGGLGDAYYRYDTPSPGFALGARFSAIWNNAFGAELFARWSPVSFSSTDQFDNPGVEKDFSQYKAGGDGSVLGLRLLARYNLPGNDLVTPFLTLGAGMDRLSTSKSFMTDGDSDLAVQAGAGVNIRLTDRARLRVDVNYFGGEGAPERKDVLNTANPVVTEATSVSNNYEVLAGVVWRLGGPPGDDDKDGLRNDVDKCPDQPEDKDGFQDDDGCPDPDNDGDGVPDVDDKCPNQAEDKDGFQDYDGCPELDNDNDGIPDSKDRCPNKPEDKDGFQDEDGCPDPDNDKDGIPDTEDKCPDQAEDFDHFRDTDGCPEPDNDYDGVPDAQDKCPGKKETVNGYQDDDGCPDEFPADVKALSTEPIYDFVFDRKHQLDAKKSKKAVARVLKVLNAYPAMTFEVHCHADLPPAKPAKASKRKKRRKQKAAKPALSPQELSVDRCEAIVEHFTKQGVKAGRLVIKARGNSQQLTPTEGLKRRALKKALQQNNRIEFKLVQAKK